MTQLDFVKVIPLKDEFSLERTTLRIVAWQEHHRVRNALVETCRRFGPTGPSGKVKLLPGVDDPVVVLNGNKRYWESGDPRPWYYIVDDHYCDELLCYASLYGDNPMTISWLASIVEALGQFEGWGLGIDNVPGSYLIIFSDRIMVKGRLARCRSPNDVVVTAAHLLKQRKKVWWNFWR